MFFISVTTQREKRKGKPLFYFYYQNMNLPTSTAYASSVFLPGATYTVINKVLYNWPNEKIDKHKKFP